MNDTQVDAVGAAEDGVPTQASAGQRLWHRLLFEGDPNEGTPVQFGLRTVLLLQAVAAGALSLLMMLDLLGAFILFVGTVLVMFWHVSPGAARARRVFADLLAGALMPVICLFFDPGILRDTKLGVIVIAAILVQIGMLLIWQLMPRGLASVSAFFAGSLSVGFLLATGIGICMLPLTLFGLLLVVGLLGTMPFLTAIVYLRNVISARSVGFADSDTWLPPVMYVAGFAMAIALPIALHQAYGQEIADYFHSLPSYGLRWL